LRALLDISLARENIFRGQGPLSRSGLIFFTLFIEWWVYADFKYSVYRSKRFRNELSQMIFDLRYLASNITHQHDWMEISLLVLI